MMFGAGCNLIGFGARRIAGGGGGAGAHRYWRLEVSARQSGNFTALAELELRETVGGANVTGSGTASANTELGGGFVASAAFDGSATTAWSSTNPSTLPDYVQYDFGAGNDVEITEFVLWAISTGGQSSASPKDFKLRHSDDASSWTDAITITGQTAWGIEQRRTYNSTGLVGGTKRLWRINITANNSGNPTEIREIEMRLTSGGADQTGSGLAFADSLFSSSFRPGNAFDGNTANSWISANVAPPHFIAYDFGVGVTRDITEVTIKVNGANAAPKDFDIQYSDDGGIMWTTSWSVTGSTAWASGETRTFTKP